ncbi:MAG: hypothetical protein LLG01_05915 [Planctomycetaceae bacterium]|nr:hypothetical protein [Planctomycetaceae bacterium]
MFYLTTSGSKPAEGSLREVLSLAPGKTVWANLQDAAFDLDLGAGKRLWIFGDVFYRISGDGSISRVTRDEGAQIARLFKDAKPQASAAALEGQYIGLLADSKNKTVTLFSDRFARIDSFYAFEGGRLHLATELDLVFRHVKAQYDQLMLANLFSTYGWYCPKGHTIYSNVKQLRVGEALTLSAGGLAGDIQEFKPQDMEEYGDDRLETYYELLREAIMARAGSAGKVWISSSSGWDSSVILGMLANELGPDKIGMIAGSMKYSAGTDVINQFEIDKINSIASFYGLKPNIVTLDFEGPQAAAYWQSVLPHYKSRHCYAYASNNFALLADGLVAAAGKGRVIFNGEASDSFHNFGFSQFGTFFHTKKSFTEYADKMNCYLFGPSFFRKCLDGSYPRDKVWQIFQKMGSGAPIDIGDGSRAGMVERFLFPFFYGSPRLPFARTEINAALRPQTSTSLLAFPYRTYMPDVLDGMTESNLYSWYVYLYMSFHAQGSTAGIHKHSMDRCGHHWRSPYIDCRLMDLLARAPERWGRGLELNNTKFPLKWVARNKIRFPYQLLDEGPHSYLYDVIEGFSLFAEITYRSGVTGMFKSTLSGKPYRKILSDECFDLAYLDELTDDFLDGKEVKGGDFSNLVSLITLCATGWY